MSVLKQKLNRKNESGEYDEIHLKTDATVITLSPTDETLLSDEITSLKSSVSNGKSLIASAITDKGVSTASDATFQTMADNISSLDVNDPTTIRFAYTGNYNERVGGVIEFLSSGILTIYNSAVVDLFLVGGGGSGGAGTWGGYSASGATRSTDGSFGGAGGYTNTIKGITISPGEYTVTIGSGGSGISGTTSTQKAGNDGGNTEILGYTAKGGMAGSNVTTMVGSTQYRVSNANGGSGGGSRAVNENTGYGGSDGSDGYGSYNSDGYKGGKGQGTTTREFGESTGKLYSGGGGGARYMYYNSKQQINQFGPNTTLGGDGGGGNGGLSSNTTTGTANTGGGGGSGVDEGSYKGAAGGSGIVCMRIHIDS